MEFAGEQDVDGFARGYFAVARALTEAANAEVDTGFGGISLYRSGADNGRAAFRKGAARAAYEAPLKPCRRGGGVNL